MRPAFHPGSVTQVSAGTANEQALKQKLDAALADNVSKAAQIISDQAVIADLNAKLAAAQAGQADPADAAAIVAATNTIQAQTQAQAQETQAQDEPPPEW